MDRVQTPSPAPEASPTGTRHTSPAQQAPPLREPALSFFFLCPAVRNGSGAHDPRPAFLQLADDLCVALRLAPVESGWPYLRPGDVPVAEVHASASGYCRLANMRRKTGTGEAGAPSLYQALLYTQHDTLTLQVLIARYDPWRGSLLQAWNELSGEVATLLGGLESGQRPPLGLLGASALLWAVSDEPRLDAHTAELETLAAGSWTPMTDTDIGPLWTLQGVGLGFIPAARRRLWILLTHPDESSDREANRRYNQPLLDRPAEFARLEAARHKFLYEEGECQRARGLMETARRRLEERSSWLLHAQRHFGRRLDELGGPESLDFQENLVRGNCAAADFRRQLTMLSELGQTLQINRRNFALNAAALVARTGGEQVAASDSQEPAAAGFLRGWQQDHTDEIFRGELGRMQAACEQVEADIQYARQLLDRYEAVLHAAGVQLQIAGQREVAAISRSGDVDTGLVVASLAAVVVLELLRLGDWLQTRPYLAANLMLLSIAGSFTAALMLAGSSPTTRKREWGSVTATTAFVAGSLAAWWWELQSLAFLPLNLLAVFAGGLMGATAYGLVVQRGVARQRERRSAALRVQTAIDEAGAMAPDLRDLLEEMPPQRVLRADDMLPEGGLRYVLPPWKIARVRQRIGNASPSIHFTPQVSWLIGARVSDHSRRYRDLRLRHWVLDARAAYDASSTDDVPPVRIQICTPLQQCISAWFPKSVLDAPVEAGGAPSWLGRLSPRRGVRKLTASLRAAREATWQAPWLVRFLHNWLPVANRLIAASLSGLGRLETRIYGGAIGLDETTELGGRAAAP